MHFAVEIMNCFIQLLKICEVKGKGACSHKVNPLFGFVSSMGNTDSPYISCSHEISVLCRICFFFPVF